MALKSTTPGATFTSTPIEQDVSDSNWLSYTPVVTSRRLKEVLAGYIGNTTLALKPGTVPAGFDLVVKKADGTLANVPSTAVTEVIGDSLRFDDGTSGADPGLFYSSSISCAAVSSDGLWFYGATGTIVAFKKVSTAWDNAQAVGAASAFTESFTVVGIYVSPDGKYLFTSGNRNSVEGIKKYSLSEPYDPRTAAIVTTKTYGSAAITGAPDLSAVRGIHISEDGLNMYVVNDAATGTISIYQFKMTDAFNPDTLSYFGIKSFTFTSYDALDVQVSPCGNFVAILLVYATTSAAYVRLYPLASKFDITSMSTSQLATEVFTAETTPAGFELRPDGKGMYVAGSTTDAFLASTWTTGSYYSYQSVDVTSLNLTAPPKAVYIVPKIEVAIDAKLTSAELSIATAQIITAPAKSYGTSGEYMVLTDSYPKTVCNARAIQFKVTASMENTEVTTLNIQLTKDA